MKNIIFLILIFAAVLRLWNLGSVPPSASLDEASIAYNAYSVMKTGGDEFGQFPLISQRGYDDWRRSSYLLISIPFIAVFNLSTVAIRLPAVILSILTVGALYLIILELFKKHSIFSYSFALLSALLLAISPWHIYISRLGHESNASLSFFVFGVLFFLKGLKKNIFLLIAVLFFTLALVSYYSGQLLVPLFIIGLGIVYFKTLKKIIFSSKRNIAVTIAIFLLVLPVLWSVFSPDSLIRYRGTSTFSQEANPEKFAEYVEKRNEALINNDLIGSFLFNRRVYYATVFFNNYISHFNPQWLFVGAVQEAFKAPYTGLLYVWQLPFILLGIAFLVKSKRVDKKAKILIFMWFLMGVLPASIATQAPHAMRIYSMIPTWQIFTAFGISMMFLHAGKLKMVYAFTTVIIATSGFISFYVNYFAEFPKLHSKAYQYALSQAVPYVLENEDKYEKIVFSNYDNLFQSYMLFLYHSKYDPRLYQEQGGTLSGGFDMIHKFGKYEFRPIKWDEEKSRKTLYVGNPKEFPENIEASQEFYYLDGSLGVKAVEVK